MTKKEAKVQCQDCKRGVNIKETWFQSAEDVAVGEFLCRLCVLGARLDRVEAENKVLVAQ